jgi:NAD(P)-dependent dehydrogenase (short-subunit alcohol dehydrogenase family)
MHIVITGASSGIGAALARELATLPNAKLTLVARRKALLDELARSLPCEVTVVERDLSKDDASTTDWLPEDVDVLVNNAGVIPSGNLLDIDDRRWRDGWDLKVFGYINLCRAYYARMKAKGGGVIVNNIGNGGEIFDPEYIAGTTGNASLMAFTRALGGYSLDDGIRVVGVNPGPVDTDRIYAMLKKRAKTWLGDEARYLELVERYPLRRPASVREITDLILFLASDRSAYTTGTIVTVDGGISSRRSII